MSAPMPPLKCKQHLIPYCKQCRSAGLLPKQPKPHGPVLERLMQIFYGPKR